jgi:hypothetical protein
LCGSENGSEGIAVIQNLLTCGYANPLPHNRSTAREFGAAHRSSARNYAGMDGLLDVFTLEHKPLVKNWRERICFRYINHGRGRPRQQRTVRLGQPSFGISLKFGESNNWSPRASGFTPNAFKIEEAYVFGAVKYNGVWKGVRMYID